MLHLVCLICTFHNMSGEKCQLELSWLINFVSCENSKKHQMKSWPSLLVWLCEGIRPTGSRSCRAACPGSSLWAPRPSRRWPARQQKIIIPLNISAAACKATALYRSQKTTCRQSSVAFLKMWFLHSEEIRGVFVWKGTEDRLVYAVDAQKWKTNAGTNNSENQPHAETLKGNREKEQCSRCIKRHITVSTACTHKYTTHSWLDML